MPVDFPASSQIHVMRVTPKEDKEKVAASDKLNTTIQNKEKIEAANGKAYSIEEVRERHKDAYKPWTEELDQELTVMYCEGVNIRDMAKHFGRTKGAIQSRMKKLELEELYG
jgi:F-box protein 18 (helicase)